LLKSISRVHHTAKLEELYCFIDRLHALFSEQLNLLALILLAVNCGDLTNIGFRLYGHRIYMNVQALIDNDAEFETKLKNPIADDEAKVDELKTYALAKAVREDQDTFIRKKLLVGPCGTFQEFGAALLETIKEAAPTVVAGRDAGNSRFKEYNVLCELKAKMRKTLGVQQPIRELLLWINRQFPGKSAYDQLNLLVTELVALHNNCCRFATYQAVASPVALVTRADLNAGITFFNSIYPVCSLIQSTNSPASVLVGLLEVLESGTIGAEAIAPGAMHPALPVTQLKIEVAVLGLLSETFEIPAGEDCFGFVEQSVFESLLSSADFGEILSRSPTTAKLSLQQWALDWAIKPTIDDTQEPGISDELRRFESLAFLILVFACQEGAQDLFYTEAQRTVSGADSRAAPIWYELSLAYRQPKRIFKGSKALADGVKRLLRQIAARAKVKIRE
jgi:hypothetical protein